MAIKKNKDVYDIRRLGYQLNAVIPNEQYEILIYYKPKHGEKYLTVEALEIKRKDTSSEVNMPQMVWSAMREWLERPYDEAPQEITTDEC